MPAAHLVDSIDGYYELDDIALSMPSCACTTTHAPVAAGKIGWCMSGGTPVPDCGCQPAFETRDGKMHPPYAIIAPARCYSQEWLLPHTEL